MWKLTIEDDEGQQTSLELGQDEYTVGRSEDAVIRLTERNVSRDHAVIRASGEGWELEDRGSYNGTYVNGDRVIGSRPLSGGDIIQLGDYRIELKDATEVAKQEAEETRRRRPDRLVMVIGPTPGKEFALSGEILTVGRAEEATVSVNHASVSRFHAELVQVGESRWEVIDKGSSNGIRINGMELRRGMIEPGDALELGDVRLRFVAAGKYYRPSSSLSQQLPAVVPFEAMSPSASSGANSSGSQRSIATIVAVAAVVCALIIGAYMLFAGGQNGPGPEPASSAAPMATSEAEEKEILKQAQEIVGEDVVGAHKLLARIPESSALRDAPEFLAVEDAWADAMFDKAANSKNNDEKRDILNEISDTATVSTDKRKKAANMALELGPDPKRPRPRPVDTGTWTPPPTSGSGGDTQPQPTSAKPQPSSAASPPPDGKFDEQAQKRALLARAMNGSASVAELRMLRGICGNDGDKACRDMAHQRIQAQQKKKKP